AGVVDDHPAVVGVAEVAQRGAGSAHRRGQRHVEHPVTFLCGQVDHRCRAAKTGVVDQDVQPPHARCGRCDQRVDLCGGRDVTHHTLDPAQTELAQLVTDLTKPAFVVVGDDDVGALGQHPTGHRGPDPSASGGRHNDYLAVQKPV